MQNKYLFIGLLILLFAGGGVVTYKLTRGIRNKNPGNIKKSTSPWRGKIVGADPVFETFDKMSNGVRAIGKLLLNYERIYGLDTVSELITRYSATDQAPYIKNVSAALGVAPDEKINVRERLPQLVSAIILQENGSVAAKLVTASSFSSGIEKALA